MASAYINSHWLNICYLQHLQSSTFCQYDYRLYTSMHVTQPSTSLYKKCDNLKPVSNYPTYKNDKSHLRFYAPYISELQLIRTDCGRRPVNLGVALFLLIDKAPSVTSLSHWPSTSVYNKVGVRHRVARLCQRQRRLVNMCIYQPSYAHFACCSGDKSSEPEYDLDGGTCQLV